MYSGPLFTWDIGVNFGDCDPAGIVYYPNFLRWADASVLEYLRRTVGGHARLCADLDILGLGLMSVNINFRSPVAQDDSLALRIETIDWGTRSFSVNYSGHVGTRLAFEAQEKRGLFAKRGDRIEVLEARLLRDHLAQAVH